MEIECVGGPLDGQILIMVPPGKKPIEFHFHGKAAIGKPTAMKYRRAGRMVRSPDGWFQQIILKWEPK